MMRIGFAAALAASAALASCRNPLGSGVACTASVEPAIVVEIRDARTGAALAARARGVVRDGAYSDSLRPHEGSGPDVGDLYSCRAADERPGTYTVEIQHPDYRAWTAAGVRVGRDECHVRTRRLRASLEPAN